MRALSFDTKLDLLGIYWMYHFLQSNIISLLYLHSNTVYMVGSQRAGDMYISQQQLISADSLFVYIVMIFGQTNKKSLLRSGGYCMHNSYIV